MFEDWSRCFVSGYRIDNFLSGLFGIELFREVSKFSWSSLAWCQVWLFFNCLSLLTMLSFSIQVSVTCWHVNVFNLNFVYLSIFCDLLIDAWTNKTKSPQSKPKFQLIRYIIKKKTDHIIVANIHSFILRPMGVALFKWTFCNTLMILTKMTDRAIWY